MDLFGIAAATRGKTSQATDDTLKSSKTSKTSASLHKSWRPSRALKVPGLNWGSHHHHHHHDDTDSTKASHTTTELSRKRSEPGSLMSTSRGMDFSGNLGLTVESPVAQFGFSIHPHPHFKETTKDKHTLLNTSSHSISDDYDRTLDHSNISYPLNALAALDAKGIVYEVIQATDTAATDDWAAVGMRVLPLFNGEPVRDCIENLAMLVKQCVHERNRNALLNDFTRFLNHGMMTINTQLQNLPSEAALLPRLADTWHFFYTDVLAYLLCVFMPIQSLNRRQSEVICVRDQILMSFRDKVFLPLADSIVSQFSKIPATADRDTRDIMSRIVQMTGLLCNLPSTGGQRERVVTVWGALMRRWHVVMAYQHDIRRPNAMYRRLTRSGTVPVVLPSRRR